MECTITIDNAKGYVTSNFLDKGYCIYWDIHTNANSVDPDQTSQITASDQGLHCSPLIQQFLDKSVGVTIHLLKF